MTKPLADVAGTSSATAPRGRGTRHVFVRDLVLDADIGIHDREQGHTQRVRINLDLEVDEDGPVTTDRIADVVSYEPLVDDARKIVAAGHVQLVETLAERLAACCPRDPRVRGAGVRVEKLDVVADAVSVGVEIERHRLARGD
ncbi:MAG: dihydroneopterin aldolase [Alphaproteobacteria bacterium]